MGDVMGFFSRKDAMETVVRCGSWASLWGRSRPSADKDGIAFGRGVGRRLAAVARMLEDELSSLGRRRNNHDARQHQALAGSAHEEPRGREAAREATGSGTLATRSTSGSTGCAGANVMSRY